METRNLNHSELLISSIGFGCNTFGDWIDLEPAGRVIHRPVDAGITLFDTADTYGTAAVPKRPSEKPSAIAVSRSSLRPSSVCLWPMPT